MNYTNFSVGYRLKQHKALFFLTSLFVLRPWIWSRMKIQVFHLPRVENFWVCLEVANHQIRDFDTLNPQVLHPHDVARFHWASKYKLSILPWNNLFLTCPLIRILAIDPMFLSDITSSRVTWEFTGHSEEHFIYTLSFISQVPKKS